MLPGVLSFGMMHVTRLTCLSELTASEWNALVPDQNPFLSYEFLTALERHGGVGAAVGWHPQYGVCRDAQGQLLGAILLYRKDHSYGEFVFDWNWGEISRRWGMPYYPKLISAIPYTPVTSPRFLLKPGQTHPQEVAEALTVFSLDEVRIQRLSSLHGLFLTPDDLEFLVKQGFLPRWGCQFHWYNRGYRDFQDFLDTLTAKRRKNIHRERRRVRAAGLEIRILSGPELTDTQWHQVHAFYCSTFHRLGGWPTLTQSFFQELADTLGEQLIVVLAWKGGQEVAAAIHFRSVDTLYGRHWGCRADYDSLHFEACYYQGLEYCIQNGLRRFEPGAQGEYKVYRGFLPTLTCSAHWIADPSLRQVIGAFLEQETPAVRQYAQYWLHHSPYRRNDETPYALAVAGSIR